MNLIKKWAGQLLAAFFKWTINCSSYLGVDIDVLTSRLLLYLLKKKRLNNRLFFNRGINTDVRLFAQYVPDRYSDNSAAYQKQANFLSFSDLGKWTKRNHQNAGDISRFFFINLSIDYLLEEKLVGNVVELGVFRGNSAFLLSKFAQRINTTCYLFDTFEGFDERDLTGRDANFKKSDFSDTSLETVRDLVGDNNNTIYVKGYFPDSLSQVDSVDELILVHLDCDLEKPIADALKYFYPRLKRGGFLIMHDHSSYYWTGARNAIDQFFKDKLEFIVPIPDKSGTCVVRKIK